MTVFAAFHADHVLYTKTDKRKALSWGEAAKRGMLVKVRFHDVQRERERSVVLHQAEHEAWVPRSMVRQIDEQHVVVPLWLAEDKGFDSLPFTTKRPSCAELLAQLPSVSDDKHRFVPHEGELVRVRLGAMKAMTEKAMLCTQQVECEGQRFTKKNWVALSQLVLDARVTPEDVWAYVPAWMVEEKGLRRV